MNGRTNSSFSDKSEESIQIPLEPVVSYAIYPGDDEIKLIGTGPVDKYAAPKGEFADEPWDIASQWDHTAIVRKINSDPASINDGENVFNSSIRNQYQSEAYIDQKLVNDINYHYGIFAVNTIGIVSAPVYMNATPKLGTMLRDITEGSVILISEDGVPTEFYVAKHNYESELNEPGRTLIARKECPISMAFETPETGIGWPNLMSSDVMTWFNDTYSKRFTQTVLALMATTTIKYATSSIATSYETGPTKFFIPSAIELFGEDPFVAKDGELLPTANILKASPMLLRTAAQNSNYTNRIHYIDSSGNLRSTTPRDAYGYVRPMFTLPETVRIHDNGNLIESLD